MNLEFNHINRLSKSVFDGLFGNIAPNHINWTLARFSDRSMEKKYQQHLIDVELPKERVVNYVGITVYLIFGFLDLMTFSEHLPSILILRWIVCAPIAFCLITATFLNSVKQYFQYVTIIVMTIGAGSIVAMIGFIGPDGGPPYIIGILAIFIFFACIQRMYFPAALGAYVATVIAYSLTIVFISPKSSNEIISGHFFMIFIASVAIVTTYMQEIRSRIDYYQRRQRELDASYIEELLIEATAADRAKISFLSILSHEMRTPLHQIVGFSEVIKNQFQNDPRSDPSRYLKEIHSSASGLLASIAKMLRYADATAGKISYDISECSVQYLTETVLEQTRAKAENAKVTFDCSGLEPGKLMIDHLHTAYAIGQLIDNAITASPTNSVIVLYGESGGDGFYTFSVKDSGRGIMEAQIEAAFKPFMQAEDVKTRSAKGIGLGLSLSRKILEDQKAELVLRSTVGDGTTAVIRLPLAKRVSAAAE